MIDYRARAAAAKRELTETEAAFDHLRAQALVAIAESKPAEVEFREMLYRTVQTIDAVRLRLRQIVDNGQIEETIQEFREQTQ